MGAAGGKSETKTKFLGNKTWNSQIKYYYATMAKYKENPALMERYKARVRERTRRLSASYDMRRRRAFRSWFQLNQDRLDTFVWERWRPVFLTKTVDKTCAACRVRNRRTRRRLWFIRKSDPELWDCLWCFLSSDVSETIPVEGAERFYKGQYVHPRSTGTGDTSDHADTQEAVDREDRSDDAQLHKKNISEYT